MLMKIAALMLLALAPAILATGCLETALVAVSVVNAVDSVSDIARRHADQPSRGAGEWTGRSSSDLFVAWGRPNLIYQRHPGNPFGGRSYIWEKSCGPAGQAGSADYERRSVETAVCQVFVHADEADKIRELNPGPECGPCPDLAFAR